MPEARDLRDILIKILTAILLMFISIAAARTLYVGSETSTEVKDLRSDFNELKMAIYAKGFIDSLQTVDIRILKGKHDIE